MKKTYKNPTLKMVKIQPRQFIAVSGILNKGRSIENSNDFGARRSSFSDWDEEE